jgi:hypothetical protein
VREQDEPLAPVVLAGAQPLRGPGLEVRGRLVKGWQNGGTAQECRSWE